MSKDAKRPAFPGTSVLSLHKCQEDIDMLLDGDFCSITNILCCISILEKHVFHPALAWWLCWGCCCWAVWWWRLNSPLPSPHRPLILPGIVLPKASAASVSPGAGQTLSLGFCWGERLSKYRSFTFLVLCTGTENQRLNVLHPNIFAGSSLYECSLIKQVLFN